MSQHPLPSSQPGASACLPPRAPASHASALDLRAPVGSIATGWSMRTAHAFTSPVLPSLNHPPLLRERNRAEHDRLLTDHAIELHVHPAAPDSPFLAVAEGSAHRGPRRT